MYKINVRLRRSLRLRSGFTLFEMLVVISIIGILLGLISTSFSAAQVRARDGRRIQDINNVQKALEQYFSLCSSYPNPAGIYAIPYGVKNVQLIPTTNTLTCTTTSTVILPRWPSDPDTSATNNIYYYTSTNPGTTNQAATATAYCLCAKIQATSSVANYTEPDCSTTAGTNIYYCVRNAQ